MAAQHWTRSVSFAAAAGLVLAGPALAEDWNAASCTEDAMLVLDASGSMVQGQGASGVTLLEGARSATREVVPAATQYRRMGLMTLGPGTGDQCSNVELRVPVQDRAAQTIIDVVDGLPADGGTPLSKAVEAAANALEYRSKSAVLVVVSDGDETCGRDPCELAARLKASAKDLTIHVIGFGAANGKSAGARCLADATHGRQVVARDTAELTTALRQTLVCPQLSETAVKESIDRSRSR
jgi:Ca-activated chloride channel family protein